MCINIRKDTDLDERNVSMAHRLARTSLFATPTALNITSKSFLVHYVIPDSESESLSGICHTIQYDNPDNSYAK